MKRLVAISLALLSVGCASTSNRRPVFQVIETPRFVEPIRTSFLRMCSREMPATHCICVEQYFVLRYGTIEEALQDTADNLQKGHDACHAQIGPKVQEELDAYNTEVENNEKI